MIKFVLYILTTVILIFKDENKIIRSKIGIYIKFVTIYLIILIIFIWSSIW